MLFNEERSHLAADQSKTFLIASHIIMFGFPVLLLLLYGRNAVQHSSSFSFFFCFLRVQLFNKRSEALMENASSIPPKSPSGILLASSWYGMLSQTSEREREKDAD